MSESTPRHGWPLLAAGQAQKEVSHNEALIALDLLVQAKVEAIGTNTPPATPGPGQCWIVGSAPTGAWTGQAGTLAGWTGGGWRFALPVAGMTVWTGGAGAFARYEEGAWVTGRLRGQALVLAGTQVVGTQRGAIAEVAGGAIVDAEARTTLAAILGALRGHGLIAS